MRLLIVNPNTSEGVTRHIRDAAQAVAVEGDVFTTVSAAFGPALIVTEQDALDAVAGVMASVDAHAHEVDGIVLASFGDTGIDTVRQSHPQLPVVGIAGGAFAAARCLGGRFAIVTFDDSLSPALEARASFYGLQDALQRVAAVTSKSAYDAANVQIDRFDAMRTLCEDCAREGVNSIILGGGPLAGLSSRIRPSVSIPVIDGTQAAIGILRAALD